VVQRTKDMSTNSNSFFVTDLDAFDPSFGVTQDTNTDNQTPIQTEAFVCPVNQESPRWRIVVDLDVFGADYIPTEYIQAKEIHTCRKKKARRLKQLTFKRESLYHKILLANIKLQEGQNSNPNQNNILKCKCQKRRKYGKLSREHKLMVCMCYYKISPKTPLSSKLSEMKKNLLQITEEINQLQKLCRKTVKRTTFHISKRDIDDTMKSMKYQLKHKYQNKPVPYRHSYRRPPFIQIPQHFSATKLQRIRLLQTWRKPKELELNYTMDANNEIENVNIKE